MERILVGLKGKNIDVNCGSGVAIRGEVVEMNDGVLTLKDEHEKVFYLAVSGIIAVSEVSDPVGKPGFIA